MSKYLELDRLVLNKIGDNPIPFIKIYVRDVLNESECIATAKGKSYPYRFVDRRLQALRISAVIRNVTRKLSVNMNE